MSKTERIYEVLSVVLIAAIVYYVYAKTGKSMWGLIYDALPPLPGIEVIE